MKKVVAVALFITLGGALLALVARRPTNIKVFVRDDSPSAIEEAALIKDTSTQRSVDHYLKLAEAEHQRQVAAAVALRKQQSAAAKRRAGRAKPQPEQRRAVLGTGGDIAMRIARCEGYPRYVYADHGPGSSASGKYGFVDGTWANYKGYSRAMYAPESIQDEKFWMVWANGAGASHWAASRSCWAR